MVPQSYSKYTIVIVARIPTVGSASPSAVERSRAQPEPQPRRTMSACPDTPEVLGDEAVVDFLDQIMSFDFEEPNDPSEPASSAPGDVAAVRPMDGSMPEVGQAASVLPPSRPVLRFSHCHMIDTRKKLANNQAPTRTTSQRANRKKVPNCVPNCFGILLPPRFWCWPEPWRASMSVLGCLSCLDGDDNEEDERAAAESQDARTRVGERHLFTFDIGLKRLPLLRGFFRAVREMWPTIFFGTFLAQGYFVYTMAARIREVRQVRRRYLWSCPELGWVRTKVPEPVVLC